MREPALTVHGDAGPITGDIRHSGTIRILGSVRPGRRIEAGGSLFVARHVRGSTLVAGVDIVVNGIVSGPGAELDAVGDIRVRQAFDATIYAGRDLQIHAIAERCLLGAGRRILASGSPGAICGGRALPGVGVEVRRLLSSGGVPVRVEAGRSPFPETTERLEERLAFARNRAAEALLRPTDQLKDIRRRAFEAATYRNLALALERRLARVGAAEGENAPPCIMVKDRGAVEADLLLGPHGGRVDEPMSFGRGAFVAVLSGERSKISPLNAQEEAARVG